MHHKVVDVKISNGIVTNKGFACGRICDKIGRKIEIYLLNGTWKMGKYYLKGWDLLGDNVKQMKRFIFYLKREDSIKRRAKIERPVGRIGCKECVERGDLASLFNPEMA